MKSVLFTCGLLLSVSASASSPASISASTEITCSGTLRGESFGFLIASTASETFDGVLFPTIDPGDQGRFVCAKQDSGVHCHNIHDATWVVRINRTPLGLRGAVFGEEDGDLSHAIFLNCRTR